MARQDGLLGRAAVLRRRVIVKVEEGLEQINKLILSGLPPWVKLRKQAAASAQDLDLESGIVGRANAPVPMRLNSQ
jgi:hypothetical protein